MSVFVVSNLHINVMISLTGQTFSYYWDGEIHYADKNTIGQILVDENYRSVNHRYEEDERPYRFTIEYPGGLTAVEVFKALHCYECQACETSDWKTTQARAIVHALKNDVIRKLPGYERAKWDW